MKTRLFFFFLCTLLCLTVLHSQNIPQGFNYQGIIRDSGKLPLMDTNITLQFQIRSDSTENSIVFTENHSTQTNAFGLVNLTVGAGNTDGFEAIDWTQGEKYLAVLLQTSPGSFQQIGVSRLQSVPYALYAGKALTAIDDGDTDPQNELQSWNTLPGIPAGLDLDGADDIRVGDPAGGDLDATYPDPSIKNGAVTTDKIADEAVITAKIANNAVTPPKIMDGAVTTGKIAAQAVTEDKLNQMGAANGQILKWNDTLSTWKPSWDSYWDNSCQTGGVKKTLAIEGRAVGIGGCPHDSVFLHITNNQQKRVGAQVDVLWGPGETRPATGMKVNVSGSAVNDGIVVFARNAGNISTGMTIVAQDNSDTLSTDTTLALSLLAENGSNINHGIELKARGAASANTKGLTAEAFKGVSATGITVRADSAAINRGIVTSAGDSGVEDFALHASVTDKVQDWAGFFDGKVGLNNALVIRQENNANAYWQIRTATGTGQFDDNYTNYQSGDLLLFSPNNITKPKGAFLKGSGQYVSPSDESLKENIKNLQQVLPLVIQLNAISYNFLDDKQHRQTIGFSAQNVASLFPELTYRFACEDGSEQLMLNYDGFSVIAVKAVQEQQAEIEQLKSENQGLRGEMDNLKREMAEMKAMLRAIQAKTER